MKNISNTVKVNKILEVKIIDLSYLGYGVAKVNNFTIFVNKALVDEIVKIKIVEVKKRFALANIIEIIKSSKYRQKTNYNINNSIAPLAHLGHNKQIEFKEQLVKNNLKRYFDLSTIKFDQTLTAEIDNYRNRINVFLKTINNQLEVGSFLENTNDFVTIDNFIIANKTINKTIFIIRDILREYNITNEINNMIIRKGYYTNEMMLIFNLNINKLNDQEVIINKILKEVDNIVSIIFNYTFDESKSKTIYNNDYYNDTLLDYKFKISSKSFYQVNTPLTEKLYKQAIKYADIQPNEVVLDAYCGIGTISIIAGSYAKQVYGIEVVKDAIEMAKINTQLNNVTNTKFLVGKSEDVISNFIKNKIKIDTVIVDPPRSGLAKSFINSLLKLKPKKIIYVSCNPITLAKDLSLLKNYSIDRVAVADMFPYTTHIESVVRLSLNKN